MKIVYAAGAVLIVAGLGFFIVSKRSDTGNIRNSQQISGEVKSDEDANKKTFKIEASNFKYNVSEIRVKKGEAVEIVLSGGQGFHDLVLPEFGVASEKIQAGATTTIEFVADKEGTFEYYCSIGTHRQMGMVGKLIVE